MDVPEAEWTGGAIAAVIAVPLLFAACVVGAWLLFRKRRTVKDSDDRVMVAAIAVACVVGAAASAVGLWWGMYPWKAEYHEWRAVSGVVETVDSRLIASGAGDGSMEDKFVVKFVDSPQQYGVIDTRAAGVKPGDKLTVTCVRRWQWSGTHGFDCNFVDLQR